ncbi:MAG: hypothetical protein QNK23_07215 [Crocinitomicaceae bacterium]|nr:hypothetical protein [Crocinitomicaceae bacterium]
MDNLTKVKEVLRNSYGNEISEKLIESYVTIEEYFVFKKWKPSELDSGHFVESVRRILEKELLGSSTPYSQNLSNFSDQVILQYQNSTGHESFRMLIPRALKSIYNIRNKRGVGHVGPVSPNEMDATYILFSVKWVLSEIVRLKSGLSTEETQKLISSISQRNIELLWKDGDVKRVLNPKISAKDQVMILLFDESPLSVEGMRVIIEYQNKVNFKKLIVSKLHKDRLIEFNKENNRCSISPIGVIYAEKLILKKI